MKKAFFFTIVSVLALFISCETKTNEQQVADKFLAFSDEQASFEPIKTAVKDKRIVILGEAGHADGTTFEIK